MAKNSKKKPRKKLINRTEGRTYKTVFGIDCGVDTGFAQINVSTKTIELIKTHKIHQSLFYIINNFNLEEILIVIEDARLRKFFGGKNVSAKAQGAGSVKRDAKVWEDFCIDLGIDYELVNPDTGTGKNAKFVIKKIQEMYPHRTSKHGRDAAYLVRRFFL